MKNMYRFLVISAGLFLTGCSLTTTETITTVNTTEPVEIWTIEDLQNLEAGQNATLMANLDLNSINWTPLFSYAEPYTGTFNGNGFTISNLTISSNNADYNGLFAAIEGDVYDLNITDFNIYYLTQFVTFAGGLAGYCSGNITNVSVVGEIDISNSTSSTYAGLLAGVAQIKMSSTTNASDFTPNTISLSSAIGSIQVNSKYFAYVGGLVGKTYSYEVIQNTVSATIDVTTLVYRAYVGGLIGHNYGGILIGYEDAVETTDINICQNVISSELSVTSNGVHASVGGIIGYDQYGVLFDNFAVSTIAASGMELYVGSLIGEEWYGKLDTSVAVSEYIIIEEEGQMLFLSSLVGYHINNTLLEDNYYLVVSNTTYEQTDGQVVANSSLESSSWYIDQLGWSEEVFDFSIINSFLP